MTDLIRREDAIAAVVGNRELGFKAAQLMVDDMRALPAVTVGIRPLVWEDVTDWRECTKCEAQALGGKYFVADLDKDSAIYSAGIDLGGLALVMLLEPDLTYGGRKPKSFPTIDAAEAALAAMTAERDAKDHAFKVAVDRALQNGGLANATQARLAKAVEAVSNGLDQIDGMAAKHNPNSIWEMSRAIRATLAEIGGE